MNFVAIDFETATGFLHSACAVGIVTVEEGKVVEQYYQLIQPPNNLYWNKNIEVHGITPHATHNSPLFPDVFPDIACRLRYNRIVAHNESFDRRVLKQTMEYYRLVDSRINVSTPWDCTMKIYRKKGFRPYRLDACCNVLGIELHHHNAISDALGCAQLYLHHLNQQAM